MIHRVSYHNFKALRDVTVELERLTVFVGPNASGKTSVLEGIDYLLRAVSSDLKSFCDEYSPWSLMSLAFDGQWRLRCEHDGGSIGLSIIARPPENAIEPPASARRSIVRRKPPEHDDSVTDSMTIEDGSRTLIVRKEVSRAVITEANGDRNVAFLRLNADSLIAPSYSEEPIPRMKTNGEGLPSLLAHIATNHPESYRSIQESLSRLVPTVRSFVLPRVPIVRSVPELAVLEGKTYKRMEERQYWGNTVAFEIEGGQIPGSLGSEGTVLLLGVLTVLASYPRPRVILLDDLDRGLHPRAQEDLLQLLRNMLEKSSDLQIVATSHSPYLLDSVRPEEVRLTTLREDGSVACARLDQHPEFEKWKHEMAPGEFWSMVGEGWVAKVGAAETKQ